jgi:hypothetical protein
VDGNRVVAVPLELELVPELLLELLPELELELELDLDPELLDPELDVELATELLPLPDELEPALLLEALELVVAVDVDVGPPDPDEQAARQTDANTTTRFRRFMRATLLGCAQCGKSPTCPLAASKRTS